MFIGKRPSVVFILISSASYLKTIKPVWLSHCCSDASNFSDFVKFHHKINILKSILHKKSYPRDFVDKCIKEILDRVLLRNVVVSTVPKKDLMIVQPYLAKFVTSNSN